MKDTMPKCCDREMKIRIETPTHFEVECTNCKDVIYIKKDKTKKPVLLDD